MDKFAFFATEYLKTAQDKDPPSTLTQIGAGAAGLIGGGLAGGLAAAPGQLAALGLDDHYSGGGWVRQNWPEQRNVFAPSEQGKQWAEVNQALRARMDPEGKIDYTGSIAPAELTQEHFRLAPAHRAQEPTLRSMAEKGPSGSFMLPAAVRENGRPLVQAPDHAHPAFTAHEYGHATGRSLPMPVQMIGRGGMMLAPGLGAGVGAVAGANGVEATDPAMLAAAGLSTVPGALTLSEEARASLRGYRHLQDTLKAKGLADAEAGRTMLRTGRNAMFRAGGTYLGHTIAAPVSMLASTAIANSLVD
jgi:hypothetical protein